MGIILKDSHSTSKSLRNPTTVKLSGAELQVLRLIALGNDSKTVADTLFVSKRTVDAHLSSIFSKLRVTNRLSAIRSAHQHGLLPFEPQNSES